MNNNIQGGQPQHPAGIIPAAQYQPTLARNNARYEPTSAPLGDLNQAYQNGQNLPFPLGNPFSSMSPQMQQQANNINQFAQQYYGPAAFQQPQLAAQPDNGLPPFGGVAQQSTAQPDNGLPPFGGVAKPRSQYGGSELLQRANANQNNSPAAHQRIPLREGITRAYQSTDNVLNPQNPADFTPIRNDNRRPNEFEQQPMPNNGNPTLRSPIQYDRNVPQGNPAALPPTSTAKSQPPPAATRPAAPLPPGVAPRPTPAAATATPTPPANPPKSAARDPTFVYIDQINSLKGKIRDTSIFSPGKKRELRAELAKEQKELATHISDRIKNLSTNTAAGTVSAKQNKAAIAFLRARATTGGVVKNPTIQQLIKANDKAIKDGRIPNIQHQFNQMLAGAQKKGVPISYTTLDDYASQIKKLSGADAKKFSAAAKRQLGSAIQHNLQTAPKALKNLEEDWSGKNTFSESVKAAVRLKGEIELLSKAAGVNYSAGFNKEIAKLATTVEESVYKRYTFAQGNGDKDNAQYQRLTMVKTDLEALTRVSGEARRLLPFVNDALRQHPFNAPLS